MELSKEVVATDVVVPVKEDPFGSLPPPTLSTPESILLYLRRNASNVKSVLITLTVFILSMGFIIYYAKNLLSFLNHIKQLGFLGNLIFILSYIPTGLPFAFMSYYIPLTLSSGFMYGYAVGIVTTMLGSVLSAWIGFYIARRFCREWIETKVRASARLSSLMGALELHSVKVTFIMRFLPIPFGWQNGLCAMTNITHDKFLIASAIGLLPENSLLIYFGYNLTSISELASGSAGSMSEYHKILLIVAVLVGVAVFFIGKRLLKTTLALGENYKKVSDVDSDDGSGDDECDNERDSKTIAMNELSSSGDADLTSSSLSSSGRIVQFKEFSSPNRGGLVVNVKLSKSVNSISESSYASQYEKDQKCS